MAKKNEPVVVPVTGEDLDAAQAEMTDRDHGVNFWVKPSGAIVGGSEPTRPVRKADPELSTMAKMERLLAQLPPESRGRVVAWLSDRYWQGYDKVPHRE